MIGIKQEPHEIGPIVANSNGGVNHSRNEKTENLSSEKVCCCFLNMSFQYEIANKKVVKGIHRKTKVFTYSVVYEFQEAADDHSSVSKPMLPDAHKLTDQDNGNDAV